MDTYCLHPIELSKPYHWLISEDDPNTVIIIAKCGACGMDCKISVTKNIKEVDKC